jgi:hypothetical protein
LRVCARLSARVDSVAPARLNQGMATRRHRLRLGTAAAAVAVLAAVPLGCDTSDVTVCELPEELNTCAGDGDCSLAYCGVECCPCERVASRRQLDETYCMGDEFGIAREACEEARTLACGGVDCLASPCPHPTRAACESGRCVSR